MVSFLFAVSLLLESWSLGRARRAIAALMDLTSPTARLKRADGREEELPPEQVPIGVWFVVKPGERIPLDGRVVRGISEVNQAPITGGDRGLLRLVLSGPRLRGDAPLATLPERRSPSAACAAGRCPVITSPKESAT